MNACIHGNFRNPDRENPAAILRFQNSCDGIEILAAAKVQGNRLADFCRKVKIAEKRALYTKLIFCLGISPGNFAVSHQVDHLRTHKADVQYAVLMADRSDICCIPPFFKLARIHKPGNLFSGQPVAAGLILSQNIVQCLLLLCRVDKAEGSHQTDGKGNRKNDKNASASVGFYTSACQFLFHPAGVIFKRPCHNPLPPLSHDPAVLNPYNPVGKLGNLVIVGNHDNGLVKLHAGTF